MAARVQSGVATGLVDFHDHPYDHFRVEVMAKERRSAFYVRVSGQPTSDPFELSSEQRQDFLTRYGEWRYSLFGDFIDAVDSCLLSPIVTKSYRYNLEDRLKPRAARNLFDLSVSAERSIPLNCVRAPAVALFFRGLPHMITVGSVEVELYY